MLDTTDRPSDTSGVQGTPPPLPPVQALSYAAGPRKRYGRPPRLTVIAIIGFLIALIYILGNVIEVPFVVAWTRSPPPTSVAAPVPRALPPPRPVPCVPYTGSFVGEAGLGDADRQVVLEHLESLANWGQSQREILATLLRERGGALFEVPTGGLTDDSLRSQITSFAVADSSGRADISIPNFATYSFSTPRGDVVINERQATLRRAAGGPGIVVEGRMLFTDEAGVMRLSAEAIDWSIQRLRRDFGDQFDATQAAGYARAAAHADWHRDGDLSYQSGRMRLSGRAILLDGPPGTVTRIEEDGTLTHQPAAGSIPPTPALKPPPRLEVFAGVLLLIEAVLGAAIGTLLLVVCCMILGNDARAYPLAVTYAAVAIALAVAGTALGIWVQPQLSAVLGEDLVPTDLSVVIQRSVLGAALAAAYPVALLVTLSTPTSRRWVAQIGASLRPALPRRTLVWAAAIVGGGLVSAHLLTLIFRVLYMRWSEDLLGEHAAGMLTGVAFLAPLYLSRGRRRLGRPFTAAAAVAVGLAGLAARAAADTRLGGASYGDRATAAIPALVSTIRNDPRGRAVAARRLVQLGEPGLATLCELAADPDPRVRSAVFLATQGNHPRWTFRAAADRQAARAAIPVLLQEAERKNDDGPANPLLVAIGLEAADAAYQQAPDEIRRLFGRMPEPGATPRRSGRLYPRQPNELEATGALVDASPAVRAKAAEYFRSHPCRVRGGVGRLLGLLRDDEALVRIEAAEAIGSQFSGQFLLLGPGNPAPLEPQIAADALRPLFEDPDPHVREAAKRALDTVRPSLTWRPTRLGAVEYATTREASAVADPSPSQSAAVADSSRKAVAAERINAVAEPLAMATHTLQAILLSAGLGAVAVKYTLNRQSG